MIFFFFFLGNCFYYFILFRCLYAQNQLKSRFDEITEAARAKVNSNRATFVPRNDEFYKRRTLTIPEPVFLAGSAGVGTGRARANHIDAFLHYYNEQEALKAAGAPI